MRLKLIVPGAWLCAFALISPGRLLAQGRGAAAWHDCGDGARVRVSASATRQGDLLEVASQHGKLRAPALVTPGIAPDVVAMPVGQGHENFTRYATGRGANPISILAPMQVAETDSLAWAATRVKVSAVGHGKLVLFGGSLTEAPAQPR